MSNKTLEEIFEEHRPSVTPDGYITFNLILAKYVAKMTGLKSKKRRKIIKRFKITIEDALNRAHEKRQ